MTSLLLLAAPPGADAQMEFNRNGNTGLIDQDSGDVTFDINGAEKARIDSTGRLRVTGGAQVGTDTNCAGVADAGTIRYESSELQLCDGSTWVALGAADCTDDSVVQCLLAAARDDADPDFTASNIADGVNILGVTGTLSGGAPDCTDDSASTCTLDSTRSNDDPDMVAANVKCGVNILGIVGTYCVPDPFSFIDQTGVALSTLIESNIVQITGIANGTSISITGDGSPAYRICGDATCSTVNHTWSSSSGNIDPGEYLQLHLTSNAVENTTNSATVAVGAGSDQWHVTTVDPCAGSPSPGDVCADGSYYIGQVGGNDIYATAAASESSQTWNNGSGNFTTTGIASNTDGPGNTADLVALSDPGSAYDAAQYCDGLTNIHGHSDWYLPAKDELNLFWNGGSPVAGVNTGSTYWSSTEDTDILAWMQRFNDGWQAPNGKNSSKLVRCVRR